MQSQRHFKFYDKDCYLPWVLTPNRSHQSVMFEPPKPRESRIIMNLHPDSAQYMEHFEQKLANSRYQ